MNDTIFALSSGAPPAAIAVVRISGPQSGDALLALTGRHFTPRRAAVAQLRSAAGDLLDSALVLWMPGPGTSTGEDTAELHCHGGRAVVSAVLSELETLNGLREAVAGEFTRRAFANGRIDLAQAEGLSDLLTAETELQRQTAMAMAGGQFSTQAHAWRERVLRLSAQVESALDFSDEDDVAEPDEGMRAALEDLARDLDSWLKRPGAEKLRDGYRVALGGPPNAGKSSLLNALVERDVAITASTPGTTRDVIEAPVTWQGMPFVIVDTAGLRFDAEDAVEQQGIARADREIEKADCVLWLGKPENQPSGAIQISAKADLVTGGGGSAEGLSVSARTGAGIADLKAALLDNARSAMPKPGEAALNTRQRTQIAAASSAISQAQRQDDWLLLAEDLRAARVALDGLLGRTSTENMLDTLFSQFCIGK